MTGKRKGLWLKLIRGTRRKRLENNENSNLCLWKGICAYEGEKWWFLTQTDRKVPYEKGWKIMQNATCVSEEGYVPMKAKRKGSGIKLIGWSLMKKAGKSWKTQLVFLKGNMCTWEELKRFLTKTDRGVPYEKGWKIMKTQLVFVTRNMRTWRKKVRVLNQIDRGPLRKRLENREKRNLC